MQITLRSGHVVMFDDDFADLVLSRKWRYATHGNKKGDKQYVSGRLNGRHVYLHRLVAGAQKGQIVDHINGDTLDNRRSNLRIVSASQNMQNRAKPNTGRQTSRFKGVTRVRGTPLWRVSIRPNREKIIWMGPFASEVEAAFAYDVASLQFHGPHGKRNFLPLMN